MYVRRKVAQKERQLTKLNQFSYAEKIAIILGKNFLPKTLYALHFSTTSCQRCLKFIRKIVLEVCLMRLLTVRAEKVGKKTRTGENSFGRVPKGFWEQFLTGYSKYFRSHIWRQLAKLRFVRFWRFISGRSLERIF